MTTLANTETDSLKELDSFIESPEGAGASLISVLQKAQEIFGCLPQKVQLHIAKRLKIPPAKVYGVVTFYSYFTMERKGTYNISVCLGTACYVRGAEEVLREFENQLDIKKGEVTRDGKFSLDSLRCVGACGLAPVVMINGKVYGHVKTEDVKIILEEAQKEGVYGKA